MKKKNLLLVCLMLFAYLANAQRFDKQEIFVATTEKQVYELYNQMLDSVRVSNRFLSDSRIFNGFGFMPFEEMESTDTLMKFE